MTRKIQIWALSQHHRRQQCLHEIARSARLAEKYQAEPFGLEMRHRMDHWCAEMDSITLPAPWKSWEALEAAVAPIGNRS